MAKYIINSLADIDNIKNSTKITLSRGDIIVHKPFEFYIIENLFQKVFPSIILFPASSGTQVYTLNGYNTSVIKDI